MNRPEFEDAVLLQDVGTVPFKSEGLPSEVVVLSDEAYSDPDTVYVTEGGAGDACFSDQEEGATDLSRRSLTSFMGGSEKSISFIVPGLFMRGDVTLLAARSGVGKSLFGLQVALCVGAGRPFLDQPTAAGAAVGLFWEDPDYILRGRVMEMVSALSIPITEQDIDRRIILDTRNSVSFIGKTLWCNSLPTDNFYKLRKEL